MISNISLVTIHCHTELHIYFVMRTIKVDPHDTFQTCATILLTVVLGCTLRLDDLLFISGSLYLMTPFRHFATP